jgi:type IV pilus assembly protein PilE
LQAASELEGCYSRNYTYTDCEELTASSPDGNYEIVLGDRSGFSDDGGFTLLASTARDDGCDTNITINALGERKPQECW